MNMSEAGLIKTEAKSLWIPGKSMNLKRLGGLASSIKKSDVARVAVVPVVGAGLQFIKAVLIGEYIINCAGKSHVLILASGHFVTWLPV